MQTRIDELIPSALESPANRTWWIVDAKASGANRAAQMVAGPGTRCLDMNDCIPDPACNCLARTLSRIKDTACATADADGCPEFAE